MDLKIITSLQQIWAMIPRYNRTNDSNGIFVTSSALIDYDLYPRFTLAVCMKASEPHEFY